MAAKVFFTPIGPDEPIHSLAEKIRNLFIQAGLVECIQEKDLTAIKIHFGEEGNDTHISPDLVLPIVKEIKKQNAKPFLTDTCVLYKSQRDNAVDHLSLAHKHGFTLNRAGAPVVIADGLIGHQEITIRIPGILFKEVSIASLAVPMRKKGLQASSRSARPTILAKSPKICPTSIHGGKNPNSGDCHASPELRDLR